MAGLGLSEGKVRAIVIAVSFLGLMLLFIIGSFSGTREIDIGEANEHEGEMVEIQGNTAGINKNSGSTTLLLYDSGEMIEVIVEDHLEDEIAGDRICVSGDVFLKDGDPYISATSSDSVDTKERIKPKILKGVPQEDDFVWVRGIVISSSYGGGDLFVTKISPLSEHELEDGPIEILLISSEEDPRSGDVINATGIFTGEGSLLCYGDTGLKILERGTPSSEGLASLVNEISSGTIPEVLHPVNVQGYLKYEPSSWSFYISDVPEGSKISVKVSISSEGFHKGDLVQLVNCSILWDEGDMRFQLQPGSVELLDPYGEWTIGLGDLPYGLSAFEDASVSVNGFIEIVNSTRYITDGKGSLEIRGFESETGGIPLSLSGIVRYDMNKHCYFLEERVVL